MGYYSCYSLSLGIFDEEKKELKYLDIDEDYINIIEDLTNTYEDAKYAFDDRGRSIDELKWYEYKNDFAAFSLKYPNIIFEVYREGEESLDLETSYFKDGKSQISYAKIEYDKFNPKKFELNVDE